MAGAQAYYLYVGSAVGARDYVNSGEIQATSYPAGGLPRGVPIYARIWVKVGGAWAYGDWRFQSNVAVITSPASNASSVDLRQPIQWTPVSGA